MALTYLFKVKIIYLQVRTEGVRLLYLKSLKLHTHSLIKDIILGNFNSINNTCRVGVHHNGYRNWVRYYIVAVVPWG